MDMYLFEQPYRTVNGEAQHIGKPCVFIRFQGCNVGCKWCDAMGTWPAKRGSDFIGVHHTTDSLLAYVDEHFPETPRLWITGGEPTEHLDEIHNLISTAARDSPVYRLWHLITAGSVYRSETLELFDHITIDVKPPSSNAKNSAPNNSFIELCMENMNLREKCEFKMVVSNTKEDINFAINMIDKLKRYKRDITIQPLYWSEAQVKMEELKAQSIKNLKVYQEAFQLPANWASYADFAEYFMGNKYENLRILPQLHKIYWPGEMNGI